MQHTESKTFIPEEKIREIRESISIIGVVSDYVNLKKKGSNYQGLCPFHQEKTPSFSVNESKNFFYCFGCHESGDVFSFLMKKENISFYEAAKQLAEISAKEFKTRVSTIGPDVIAQIAKAGPELQAQLLKGLGIKSVLITDGKNPLNLFSTAKGLIGDGNPEPETEKFIK